MNFDYFINLFNDKKDSLYYSRFYDKTKALTDDYIITNQINEI